MRTSTFVHSLFLDRDIKKEQIKERQSTLFTSSPSSLSSSLSSSPSSPYSSPSLPSSSLTIMSGTATADDLLQSLMSSPNDPMRDLFDEVSPQPLFEVFGE